MRPMKICGLLLLALMMAFSAAAKEDPYEKPDDSWISVSGMVVETAPDSFILDYGEGLITVEMDDWDWYRQGTNLLEGDQVTVYGQVDNDLWETARIEANSIYVDSLNTYFYASDADQENVGARVTGVITAVPATDWMDLSGVVTAIDGREFTLDTGLRKMTVDTITMPYNPMDDKGFQKIEKGDLVKVYGDLNLEVFEERELLADMIITLVEDEKKTIQ